MHKAKQDAQTGDGAGSSNGSSNGAASRSTGSSNGAANGGGSSDGGARTVSAGSGGGFEAGEVDSLGQYDPETDRFVGGAAGFGGNGHKATGEEQLRIEGGDADGGGGADMTQKGAEWGLLQLDLSFAWRMEDKPVDDVEQLLQEAAAVQVSAATR
jgi:hypothetical protein